MQVQRLLMSATFRVYTHTDVIGVELGGVLKNIVALGAGLGDGLGLGDNAKAGVHDAGIGRDRAPRRRGRGAGAHLCGTGRGGATWVATLFQPV